MRIIQVIPSLGVGGAERVCEGLAYEIEKLGHEVIVISLYTENTIITNQMLKKGCNIVFLNKRTGIDFKCVKKLRKIIRDYKPDAIHTHLYALKYVALACIGLDIKIIHTVHNIAEKEANSIDQVINKLIFKTKKAFPVALSDEIKKSIITRYAFKSTQVAVVENGVDLSRCIVKDNYEINGVVNIIHVGRFFEQKNHAYMIKSMKTLREKFDIQLSFYGDGALLDECKKIVNDEGLQSIVLFKGVSDNIYTPLHSSDIFILPSKWEGLPIGLIEAMGTGLPIIASNVGGIPDMIENGESGILIDPVDGNLEEAITSLIENDRYRESIGRNAYLASDRFSASKMAKSYLLLYKKVADCELL